MDVIGECAGADLARPDFELVLFERGGPLRVALYGLALVTGTLRFLPGVRHVRARDIRIRGLSAAPVQGGRRHRRPSAGLHHH